MAKTQCPRRTNRYSGQFKLTAVRLSQIPGVQVKDVAEAVATPPWRAPSTATSPATTATGRHSALGYCSPIDYERAHA